MKNRLLVPILEGSLSLPDDFDVNKFDYSILEDVLSVEGLGDILSDIPDQIRDRLVDLKVTNEDRVSNCDLCTKLTKIYVMMLHASVIGVTDVLTWIQQRIEGETSCQVQDKKEC